MDAAQALHTAISEILDDFIETPADRRKAIGILLELIDQLERDAED